VQVHCRLMVSLQPCPHPNLYEVKHQHTRLLDILTFPGTVIGSLATAAHRGRGTMMRRSFSCVVAYISADGQNGMTTTREENLQSRCA
jgi:hypothetical protein